jgi:hypothetical protein
MFFIDKEHENNFNKMMDLYDLSVGQDVEYESAIYVAAHPEVFKCYDLNKLDIEFGPLGCLLNGDDTHDVGALTGTTRALVEMGHALYGGNQMYIVDMCIYGEESLKCFVQACRIRARL